MVLATAVAMAQQETPSVPAKPVKPSGAAIGPAAAEVGLKTGSPVKAESLASATWVRGEPLREFESGKVYMFECWATWCGPCIAAIPHINGLHKKYHDKGLRVIGVNVWEDGLEKVEKFVKDKGEGMSYPVVYTGRGSDFEKEWLKPAGVKGIPHAFIVRDGKLVLTSHPSQLTDAVIESLLSGEEGAAKATEELNAARNAREKSAAVMMAFRQAGTTNDVGKMAEKLAEFEQLVPESPYLDSMRLDLLIARKDWDGATKRLQDMPDGRGRQMTLAMTANRIGTRDEGFPEPFLKAVASAYAAQVEKNASRQNPMEQIALASLQWKSGDKENALASAKKAADAAKASQPGRSIPAEPFTRFAEALEDGKLPALGEFSGWVREAMSAGRTAPAAARDQP